MSANIASEGITSNPTQHNPSSSSSAAAGESDPACVDVTLTDICVHIRVLFPVGHTSFR